MGKIRRLLQRERRIIELVIIAVIWATWQTFVSCRSGTQHIHIIELDSPKIDINTATKADLMTLPGIGEIKAQRIIDGRLYQSVNELRKLSGFGDKTIANIRDKVTVTEPPEKINWLDLRWSPP